MDDFLTPGIASRDCSGISAEAMLIFVDDFVHFS